MYPNKRFVFTNFYLPQFVYKRHSIISEIMEKMPWDNRMRAVCRLGLRTHEAALSDIRKALSLAPDSNISFVEWQTLAEAEFGLGNLDAARKASQMAVARNQKFVWSLFFAGGGPGRIGGSRRRLQSFRYRLPVGGRFLWTH